MKTKHSVNKAHQASQNTNHQFDDLNPQEEKTKELENMNQQPQNCTSIEDYSNIELSLIKNADDNCKINEEKKDQKDIRPPAFQIKKQQEQIQEMEQEIVNLKAQLETMKADQILKEMKEMKERQMKTATENIQEFLLVDSTANLDSHKTSFTETNPLSSETSTLSHPHETLSPVSENSTENSTGNLTVSHPHETIFHSSENSTENPTVSSDPLPHLSKARRKVATIEEYKESRLEEYYNSVTQRDIVQWVMDVNSPSQCHLHCINGPAWTDGTTERYFVLGEEYTKEEYEELAFRQCVLGEYLCRNGEWTCIVRYETDEIYVDSQKRAHRTDGPAIVYGEGNCDFGHKAWYLHGKRHRLDGPACEYADGSKEWWVEGKMLTEEEFNQMTNESIRKEFNDRVEWHNKEGQFHRTDGPAVEYADGTKEWWVEGKRHRLDGPAVEWANGYKSWWIDGKKLTEEEFSQMTNESIRKEFNDRVEWHNKEGQLHREDGPAIEWANGDKEWWVDGKCHRLDGPAIEWADGTKSWWIDGKMHRLDGPAVEWVDGSKAWYVEGERLTEGEYVKICAEKKVSLTGAIMKGLLSCFFLAMVSGSTDRINELEELKTEVFEQIGITEDSQLEELNNPREKQTLMV